MVFHRHFTRELAEYLVCKTVKMTAKEEQLRRKARSTGLLVLGTSVQTRAQLKARADAEPASGAF
jgi:hypothetical protein